MPSIEPKTLKALRELKRLTLDQLANRSSVDKQTIHRLERGKRNRAHARTVEKLAKALGVKEEKLATSIAVGEEADAVSASEPNKSQLNLRVSNRARNALLLVSERYGVNPAQIVELAPFLFFWAAQKCLRQRGEYLDSLYERHAAIWKSIEEFVGEVEEDPAGYLAHYDLENPWDHLADVLNDESAAVGNNFLFNTDEFGERRRGGPIADFLAELASELDDQVEFEGWDWNSSPAYSLCKEEAERLANEDEVALENILEGHAPLHELPKGDWEEFRRQGAAILADDETKERIELERQRRAEERVKWLRSHSTPDSNETGEAAS